MPKKNKEKASALTIVIRILIVIIFCLALFIASNRLMEFNEKQREAAELEEERNRLNEALGDGSGAEQSPND